MFKAIHEEPLPETALLRQYTAQGHYTDCFATTIANETTLPAFVEAFYTTALFKAERFILARAASLPSTDVEASQVACGEQGTFAAWNVEDRTDDQLLLIDVHQRTGSWFMSARQVSGSTLYFGSVVFRPAERGKGRRMPFTFRALLSFHRLYSRALLSAARSRLLQTSKSR